MLPLILLFNFLYADMWQNKQVRIVSSSDPSLYLADFPGIGLRLVRGHSDNDIAVLRAGQNGNELWFRERQICSDNGNKLGVCEPGSTASSGWSFECDPNGLYYVKHNNQCLRVGSRVFDTTYEAYEVVLDDCLDNCEQKFIIEDVERENILKGGTPDFHNHCYVSGPEMKPNPGLSGRTTGGRAPRDEQAINLNIKIDGGRTAGSDNEMVVCEPAVHFPDYIPTEVGTSEMHYAHPDSIPAVFVGTPEMKPASIPTVLVGAPEMRPASMPTVVVGAPEIQYSHADSIPTVVVGAPEMRPAQPASMPVFVRQAPQPAPVCVAAQPVVLKSTPPAMVVKRTVQQPPRMIVRGSFGPSSNDNAAGHGGFIGGGHCIGVSPFGHQGGMKVVRPVALQKEIPRPVYKVSKPVVSHQVARPVVVAPGRPKEKFVKKYVKIEQPEPKERLVLKSALPKSQAVVKPVICTPAPIVPTVVSSPGSSVRIGASNGEHSPGASLLKVGTQPSTPKMVAISSNIPTQKQTVSLPTVECVEASPARTINVQPAKEVVDVSSIPVHQGYASNPSKGVLTLSSDTLMDKQPAGTETLEVSSTPVTEICLDSQYTGSKVPEAGVALPTDVVYYTQPGNETSTGPEYYTTTDGIPQDYGSDVYIARPREEPVYAVVNQQPTIETTDQPVYESYVPVCKENTENTEDNGTVYGGSSPRTVLVSYEDQQPAKPVPAECEDQGPENGQWIGQNSPSDDVCLSTADEPLASNPIKDLMGCTSKVLFGDKCF